MLAGFADSPNAPAAPSPPNSHDRRESDCLSTPALGVAAALAIAAISDDADAPPALLDAADCAANGVLEIAEMLEMLIG